jgi:hypothetical protein
MEAAAYEKKRKKRKIGKAKARPAFAQGWSEGEIEVG